MILTRKSVLWYLAECSYRTDFLSENSGTGEDTKRRAEYDFQEVEEMASRNIFLPKESNRRIPNGTYGGVRGMNNLYSIGRESGQFTVMPVHA